MLPVCNPLFEHGSKLCPIWRSLRQGSDLTVERREPVEIAPIEWPKHNITFDVKQPLVAKGGTFENHGAMWVTPTIQGKRVET